MPTCTTLRKAFARAAIPRGRGVGVRAFGLGPQYLVPPKLVQSLPPWLSHLSAPFSVPIKRSPSNPANFQLALAALLQMASTLSGLLFGALGVALYYVIIQLWQKGAAQSKGCQPPPKRHTRDPLLGIGYKVQDAESVKRGKTLPDGEDLHRVYGSTYRETTIFGMTIKTACEKNIHAVFGLKAKEWGIKAF